MRSAEQGAVITGIGMSQVGRRLGRTGLDLTLESCTQAIQDAGLTPADIDGVASYPGDGSPVGGASVTQLQDVMRLDLSYFGGYGEGPAQLTGFHHACLAVATGLARHVLVYRTVTEATAFAGGVDGLKLAQAVPGIDWLWQWTLPYGGAAVPSWVALFATRYFHEHGATREDLAAIAMTFRKNAALNPDAVYRAPLDLDEYLSSRMISSPFCLYDCDVPVDGSTAFVVSAADYAPDAPRPGVQVMGLGWAPGARRSWAQLTDLYGAALPAARQMWERSGLRPDDVDVAGLYDGFTLIPMLWLEAMGFCGPGEAAAYIDGGRGISRGGRLPVNPHGGQLSAGRLHGYGFLHEMVTQLRGDAGERQVAAAEVAVASNGIGPASGCVALARWR